MIVALFAEPVRRRYEAPWGSFAHLFAVFSTVLAVFLPFFLCYPDSWAGGSIWLKQDKYREQPDLQYLYKFLIRLQLYDGVGTPQEIFYSTLSSANKIYSSGLRMGLVKTIQVDDDLDGQIDRFQISSTIPLEIGEEIYGVQVSI
jgi:hypothetical protein